MGSYVRLLRENHDFRNLWLATMVSYAGDWFNLLASAALVAHLTDSGLAISALFLARFLPLFFFTPIAGVLADRFDRKRLLIAADLLRAFTVLAFILVQVTQQVWLLYVLTVIQFALSALFAPTHSAVIPNLVDKKELVTANALDGFTWSTMLALGALAGGVVATLFGLTTAFVLDALTFVWSAWFISRIAGPTRQGDVATTGAALLQFVDGLRYLHSRPFILTMSLIKGGAALCWGALNVLEVGLAEQIFPIGEKGAISLSIFYAMNGIGSGLGPLLVRRWLGDSRQAALWALTVGFALLTVGMFWLSLAATLPEAAVATLVRTLGGGSLWVFSAALLQMLVADAYRGRVFAFEFTLFTLSQSLSTLWAGLAQDALGLDVRGALYYTSYASLALLGAWLIFQFRHQRRTTALEP